MHPPTTIELEVAALEALTPEVRRLVLRRPGGGALAAFQPGAHLPVIAHTDGGAAQRCYSLVNPGASNDSYEIAVKREAKGGGGSRFMHQLRVGDRVWAGAPRNDFTLLDVPHEVVLIAGGIGITPIYAMAQAAQARGWRYQLHYGARSPELMPYRQAIETLAGAAAHFHFDGGDPTRGMSLPQVLGAPGANRHVYVCGPRALIDATLREAGQLGWSREHVHIELFAPSAPVAGDRPIVVSLALSGQTLTVAADQSILDAMLAAGCDPLFDCRRGECGMCAVKLLDGVADHRDYALSDDERAEGKVCICVSRARTEAITLEA